MIKYYIHLSNLIVFRAIMDLLLPASSGNTGVTPKTQKRKSQKWKEKRIWSAAELQPQLHEENLRDLATAARNCNELLKNKNRILLPLLQKRKRWTHCRGR